MKTRFRLLNSALALVSTFLLVGCLDSEQKLVLNPDGSGKAQIKILLSGAGAINFGEEEPDPEKAARDSALGLLGGATGVEAWSDVKFGVNETGKTEFTAVAYFPDITKFSVGSMAGGGMSTDVGESGWKMERDGDVVVLTYLPMGDADGEEVEAEDPPEDIDAAIKKERMEFQQMKPMMAGFLADMKSAVLVKVPGEIEEARLFEQKGGSVAAFSFTGKDMLDGMEKAMMDDDLMRRMAAEGQFANDSPPASAEMMNVMFGAEACDIRFKAGEPQFDYAAEVSAAKEGQSDELKELLKEAEEDADESTSFDMTGDDEEDEPAGDPDPDFAAAAKKHIESLAPSFTAKNGNQVDAVVDSIGEVENDGKQGSAEIEVSFSHGGETEDATVTISFSKKGDGWEANGFSAGALPDFLGDGLEPVRAISAWAKKE